MPLHVRNAGAWTQFPTTPAGTRLLYVRSGGTWRGVTYFWTRYGGTWVKEPNYVGQSDPPTNLHVTSNSTDYSGISVAWDAPTSGAPPTRYRVSLRNAANVEVNSAITTSLSYRFSASQTTQYKVAVADERTPGAGDWQYTAPVNWYVGRASYDANDTPIYGWGGTYDWRPVDISWDPGNSLYPPSRAIDGSWEGEPGRSFWLSRANPYGTGSAHSYEGFEVHLPYWERHLVVGVHVWTPNPIICWWSCIHGSTWQGTHPVTTTDYAPLNHNWVSTSFSSVSEWTDEGAPANLVTDGSAPYGDGNTVWAMQFMVGANLVYNPWSTGGFRGGLVEVRARLKDWVVTGYGSHIIPADPSRAW